MISTELTFWKFWKGRFTQQLLYTYGRIELTLSSANKNKYTVADNWKYHTSTKWKRTKLSFGYLRKTGIITNHNRILSGKRTLSNDMDVLGNKPVRHFKLRSTVPCWNRTNPLKSGTIKNFAWNVCMRCCLIVTQQITVTNQIGNNNLKQILGRLLMNFLFLWSWLLLLLVISTR